MMVSTARAVVCLSLWLSVCQVGGSHIPVKMNRTIQTLLQHYGITRKELFSGNPVFSKDILSGKLETKRVLMGGILDVYEKLLGQMLKQLPTPSPQTDGSTNGVGAAFTAAPGTSGGARSEAGEDVRSNLNYILKKVQDLKEGKYKEQDNLLEGLQSLRHIQKNDTRVQAKALFELPLLYEEASSLSDNIKMQRRRRRRRQARRVKTHPKA